ncbi:MAG: MerR family transcriptional regulator [bacterium]|nr:MerR family transcriptional regulator [bacterium]
MRIQIPDKLYFSISEASALTGIKSYVLRYWESEFDLLKPAKNGAGQRRYRKKDIELICQIDGLLHHELYTIAGAKKRLAEGQAGQIKEVGEVGPDISWVKKELTEILEILE